MSSLKQQILAAATFIGLSISASPLFAQQSAVLKGSQVTEDALVLMLAIEGPQTAEGDKMRGFRPAPSPSSRPARAPGPGKANLMITFMTDSAVLTAEGIKVLDTVARALQTDTLAGFSFRVEGHADPRGQAERNLSLSEQRAKAVVDYLVGARGILPERLVPIGKGSSEPMDPKRVDAPENRRVTIVTTR
jgi:OmpA-OmpF porin, OOP family